MRFFEIGRVERSWGLKGWVRGRCFLEDASVLAGLREVYVGEKGCTPRPRGLQALDVRGGRMFLKIAGVDDRNDAEGLRGARVFLPRIVFPEPPAGEYYWQDLLGMAVSTENGAPLGEIVRIVPAEGHDVYVCRGAGGEVWIPAVAAVVRRVDPADRVMVVAPPEKWQAEECSASMS